MLQEYTTYYQSPLGPLKISGTADYISEVTFYDDETTPANSNNLPPLLIHCVEQLIQYFNGERRQFDLPVQQEGSAFQQKVWAALTGIPYGRTISYLELSKRIGNVKAIRAVGTTNGNNSLPIIVPCHRVIGSDGSLTGYSGELWRKKWLLEHEAKYANGVQTLF